MNYAVFSLVHYGPLGHQGYWISKLYRVGTVTAPDELAAVAEAKRQGFVLPLIGSAA